MTKHRKSYPDIRAKSTAATTRLESVTARRNVVRRLFERRNDDEGPLPPDIAPLVAQIRAGERPGAHDAWTIIHTANEYGCICAKCARELGPEEPVWRQAIRNPNNVWGSSWWLFGPVCRGCKETWRHFRPVAPCRWCGRPVHVQVDGRTRYWTSCSEVCSRLESRRFWCGNAREERRTARGEARRCADCGESFEPQRADVRYCSGACKQRAYRRRVTANKIAAG